jgi:acrylyl-CoA reductase (NADPH)
MTDSIRALVLRQGENKSTLAAVETLSVADLPDEQVRVAVDYSTINYKDALAVTGKGKIVRQWPLVPGIDLAGTVIESASDEYSAGDRVVLNGWGVGEGYWGGFAQQQRVKPEWLVPLPAGISSREAMAIGTAGYTAMLCVMALQKDGITPDRGAVIVTGSTGGVGSVAIALLAKLGYEVHALTGKPEAGDYLRELGAAEIVSGEEWGQAPRPLEKQRWAGAVDTVGSQVLARLLAEMHYDGAVAACGLAGGFDLPTTVMPFILRGVKLLGVDSVMAPRERRIEAWQRLDSDLPRDLLEKIGSRVVSLDDTPAACADLMSRKVTGRVLVDPNL